MVPVAGCLGLGAVLFGIGLFGFLSRRNIILMLVSIEIMLNAVNVTLAGFSQQLHDSRGQVLALVAQGAGLAFLISKVAFLRGSSDIHPWDCARR